MHNRHFSGIRRQMFLRFEGMHPAALGHRDGVDVFRSVVRNQTLNVPSRLIHIVRGYRSTCGVRPTVSRTN